jgi:hypothetical protein
VTLPVIAPGTRSGGALSPSDFKTAATREDQMKRFQTRRFCLATTAAAAIALAGIGAATAADSALTGRVSSLEEGAMEGVLVSAQKDNASIRITVVTDAQGRYAFPAAKLEPGT